MVENYYNQESEEQGTNNKDLYKKFGRESDVGKLLYGMYAQKQKPKIEYPPVKTKPRVEAPKEIKPCPQKTQIEYPEQPRQESKYNPIDFVPKRKAGADILAEIEH
jgi:hypothetical protein